MVMAASGEWWDCPTGDKDLAPELWSRVSRFSRAHRWYLDDVAALSWQYERERLSLHDGFLLPSEDSAAAGLGLRQRFPWLTGLNGPSLNIMKTAVDTVLARLFTDMPALQTASSGAKFEERETIRTSGLALDGTLNQRTLRKVQRMVARDGLVKGWGCAWPYVEAGKPGIRRMHRWQVMVDPYDAREGTPSMAHAWYCVPRATLIASVAAAKGLPNQREILASLRKMPRLQNLHGPGTGQNYSLYDRMAGYADNQLRLDDALLVLHSWKLPGGQARPGEKMPKGAAGRWVVTVHGGGPRFGDPMQQGDGHILLADREWTRTTLPLVWWSPYPADEGIDGAGLGHMMMPWQQSVDRTLAKIQETLDRLSHAKVLMAEDGAPNSTDALAAGIAVVKVKRAVMGEGAGFAVVNGPVLNGEEFRFLEWVLAASQDYNGINAMLSTGGSRLGANASGVALVNEDTRQLDRLAALNAEFDDMRVALGREMLNAIDDALAHDKGFEAQWKGTDGVMQRRPWAELLGHGDLVVEVEQVGLLGRTKAGRLQSLIEYTQRVPGIPADLSTEMLMSSPDLQALARSTMAPQRLVEWHLAILCDPKADHSLASGADAHVPAQLGMDKALLKLQEATAQNADVETLSRLMAYRQQCADRMKAEAAAMAPEPAPMGAEMPAMPPMGGEQEMMPNV